ncbi:hypothetical protein EZ428_20250 [Pedobacter frigiditerrae]|uniref:DUF2846 domain-containing protein n=1 Tax=Pedobacter frigiditerrae TaxID=2530452 RepID=A0A4R0MNI3_9SPHI|nr:hypothetical protein [Pedobacter frigiditerrae]TCC88057.1 hypothetical protein EZ428_20250 [Pedobacter frigiditerrae]
MKKLIFLFTVLLNISASAQNLSSLNDVSDTDTLSSGKAIIYGNFIQRLGFSSGGFPQDIRIINIDTKEIFAFRVKPAFKSAKENQFIYFIKPGRYAIVNYWWTQSKVYGGAIHTEPIFKGVDATDNLEDKIKTGQIKVNELTQFTFHVSENSLNYLGSWHFDKGLVSFTDNKEQCDKKLNKLKKLDFAKAKTELPN